MSGVDHSAVAFRGLRAFDESVTAASPERRLMLATIINAMADAKGAGSISSRSEREKVQREALAWFRSGGPDFQQVCCLAGLDPHSTRRAALRFIASPQRVPYKSSGISRKRRRIARLDRK